MVNSIETLAKFIDGECARGVFISVRWMMDFHRDKVGVKHSIIISSPVLHGTLFTGFNPSMLHADICKHFNFK